MDEIMRSGVQGVRRWSGLRKSDRAARFTPPFVTSAAECFVAWPRSPYVTREPTLLRLRRKPMMGRPKRRAWEGIVMAMTAMLVGCTSEPSGDQRPTSTTTPSTLPSTSTSEEPPTPSVQPSRSATPSAGSAPPSPPSESWSPLRVRDGFLAIVYSCTFAADSFQGEWIEEARKATGFDTPGPTERYPNDAASGRADLIFGKAFNAGVGSKNPVRIRSRLEGEGRLTIWMTKPHPAPGLDVDAAAATTLDDMAGIMSSTRTGAKGGCTVLLAEPLPPMFTGTPDDT